MPPPLEDMSEEISKHKSVQAKMPEAMVQEERLAPKQKEDIPQNDQFSSKIAPKDDDFDFDNVKEERIVPEIQKSE